MTRAALLAILLIAGSADAQVSPVIVTDHSLTGKGSTSSPMGVHLATGSGLTDGGGTTGLGLLTSCASGQMLRWSGSAWVCGSIVDDGTHVGLGLASPTHQLSIDSTAACSGDVPDSACLPVVITEYAAAGPSITFRRALGSQGSPSAITPDGQFLGQLRAQGYTTTGYQHLPQVFLEVGSAEATGFTASAQGTYLQLRTVGIGTTNAAGGIKLDSNSNVGMGKEFGNETVPHGLDVLSSVAFPAWMQPTALGSSVTVNDYSPTDTLSASLNQGNAFGVRLYCQGTDVITGMTDALGQTYKAGSPFGTLGGRLLVIDNIGSGTCTFPSENTGSLAKNRYTNPSAATFTLPPGALALFQSDPIEGGGVGRWKVIGTAGGYYAGAPGSGTVTGTGTANTTTKWSSTTAITNAWPLDDGTTWGVSGKFTITEASGNAAVNGSLTADGGVRVFDVAGNGLSSTLNRLDVNIAGASCSAGQHVSAISSIGAGTCTADSSSGTISGLTATHMPVASSGTAIADTPALYASGAFTFPSSASGVDTMAVTYTQTAQASDRSALAVSNAGTFNESAGSRSAYGIKISNTATSTTNSFGTYKYGAHVTMTDDGFGNPNYAIYADAPSANGNSALFDHGSFTVNGIAQFNGTLESTAAGYFDSTLDVTGAATFASTINSGAITSTAGVGGVDLTATGFISVVKRIVDKGATMAISSCGAGASVVGGSVSAIISIAAGTTCTGTFGSSVTFNHNAICDITTNGTSKGFAFTTTTTGFSITSATAGQAYHVNCHDYN